MLTVEAVDVPVAEHAGGEARAVRAGRLLVGADGLVGVEERLGRRHVGRHVAVADDALEVADLPVDVEEEARRAIKVVHLAENQGTL